MALIVVASAKGAPGVTTLAVALAALTPGAIVADLDPDGGDIALRYGREDGAPLDPEVGLLSLAASLRRDHTDVVSATGPVDEHLQVTAGGLDVLLGVAGPDQAVGLGPLWSPLARALAETERTVFADCGRLGPSSPAMPVLMQADAVLLLARAEVEELAHLRERLRFLTVTLPSRYAGPARIGVILVAKERDRAAGPRTEQLLRASGLAVPVLGTIADDARGAGRLRGQYGGRAGRSTLVRSVRSLLPAVSALTGTALTVGILTEAALTNGAVPTNGAVLTNGAVPTNGAVLTSTDPANADPTGNGVEPTPSVPPASQVPSVNPAPADAASSPRSPYRHAWEPAPEPKSPEPESGASNLTLGADVIDVEATSAGVINSEQPAVVEQSVAEQPAEEFFEQPSENGWPRPGRGRGTLSGVAARVIQNWGR